MTAIMTDYSALLRAVLERPEDDAPRLILADWLDENGQEERAEFIRVQVELARMTAGCPEDCAINAPECKCRWHTLSRRDAQLLGPPGILAPSAAEMILSSLEQLFFDCQISPKISRGFVSEITLTQQAFLDNAKAIFESQPVTRVTMSDKRPTDYGRNDSSSVVFWEPGYDYQLPHQLPMGLATFAQKHAYTSHIWKPDFIFGGLMVYPFPTESAALAALSAACVAYGRKLAGLSTLKSDTGELNAGV